MSQINEVKNIDTTANPAPLGLCAFGLTTVLLNLHNAGLYPMDTMILAMGIFYGGLAQILVGYMEWKKGNTFGTVAFSSYGFFWLTLVGMIVMPKHNTVDAATEISKAWYLGMWGVFSLGLFFATLKLTKSLRVVFFLVVVLFFLLALANATGNHEIHIIAGIEGILCGLSALYTGMAQVINEVYKKTVLPL